MNPTRSAAMKRDIGVVSRGLRNSSKRLMQWVNEPSDKEAVKHRVLITMGVPAGFIFVGYRYPAPVISAGIVLLLATVFWFARTEERAMAFTEDDFEGPYCYAGRVVDFEELLRSLVRAHPSATLEDIAEHICEAFGGPDLSEGELAAQMRLYGIGHASFPGPSPAEVEAPLVSEEKAGQDRAEGAPEGAEKNRGRVGALRHALRLASQGKEYAVALAKERKSDEQRPEEPGPSGVDQPPQGREGTNGESGGGGDGGRAEVRGPQGGDHNAGGLPGADGRNPEVPATVANGPS